MSINTAFYQIAKNVTASDLAKIIGAKITGVETVVAEKAAAEAAQATAEAAQATAEAALAAAPTLSEIEQTVMELSHNQNLMSLKKTEIIEWIQCK